MVVIESPYLTIRQVNYFIPILSRLILKGVKIRVNTRQFNHHNKLMGCQAKRAADLLVDCGVKVYLYGDLRHRKLAIIDDRILWEGSLNILSHYTSIELMRRTASASLSRQMIKFTSIYY